MSQEGERARRYGEEVLVVVSKREQTEQMRKGVPSTIARSDDKAVRTYKKTLQSAEESYGSGQRARRAAIASLKHTHEKVGDHWEPKPDKGPSDRQAQRSTPESREQPRPTAGGVDANASKQHLIDRARELGIQGPTRRTKAELVEAINKANTRASARARGR